MTKPNLSKAAAILGRKGGKIGGANVTEKRRQSNKQNAVSRWRKIREHHDKIILHRSNPKRS